MLVLQQMVSQKLLSNHEFKVLADSDNPNLTWICEPCTASKSKNQSPAQFSLQDIKELMEGMFEEFSKKLALAQEEKIRVIHVVDLILARSHTIRIRSYYM